MAAHPAQRCTPWERDGDLAAQLAIAHTTGAARLSEIVERYGIDEHFAVPKSIDYAQSLTPAAIRRIPNGCYSFTDFDDDDRQSDAPVPIRVTLTVEDDSLMADFAGGPSRGRQPQRRAGHRRLSRRHCLRCVAMALLEADPSR